nr:UvrD-like helicase, ATP-binding domain, P-loop containing nucleoside triphosphate hydrolase [Tanacetum cinerariifolium]
MHRNLKIIKEVLYFNSKVKEYIICRFGYDRLVSQKLDPHLLVNLNDSQTGAVMAALCKTQCFHISSLKQIWGLLGTGKTMTVLMVEDYYPVPKALAKDIDISLNHRYLSGTAFNSLRTSASSSIVCPRLAALFTKVVSFVVKVSIVSSSFMCSISKSNLSVYNLAC